jgi:hypothetical protein
MSSAEDDSFERIAWLEQQWEETTLRNLRAPFRELPLSRITEQIDVATRAARAHEERAQYFRRMADRITDNAAYFHGNTNRKGE